MKVLVMTLDLRAEWVHSLKEKRMVVRSITQRLKNKYNISVNEVDNQDIHQIITIGVSGICATNAQVDSTTENIINFVESNTDAELINISKDVIVF
ncbi:DUF503 domain-containing protein [Clostridium nigeriense]|uniref:DUF503 domain-containing protein n=1 Tax=Clostridium nigeriense TaxID=1805470 RepID=UPI003D33C71A